MTVQKYLTMKDQLQSGYLEKFNFVEYYGQIHRVSEDVMGEKMMDLMDLMLEAQSNGVPVEQVIGTNTADFCKNFFSDITVVDTLKNAARRMRYFAWVLFVLESLFLLSEMGRDGFQFFTYRTTVNGYFIGLASGWCGLALADLTSIVLAKLGNYSRRVWVWVAVCCTVLSGALAIALFCHVGDILLPGHPIVILSAGYLLAYYAVTMWKRYHATGSLRKPRSFYETSFSGFVREEIKKTDYSKDLFVVKTFAKRYKRANAWRYRRGKEPLTTQAYFERVNRQSRYAGGIGYTVGIGLCIILDLLSGEMVFDSVQELGIFLLFSCGVVLVIRHFMKKVEKIARIEQTAVLAACQERGVEVDAYYEILLAEKKAE